MPIPLFHNKAELAASYTPRLFLDALRAQGWEPGQVPDAVIYTYARFELYLATVPDLYTPNHMLGSGPNTFFIVNDSDGRLAINCLPIGAPAAIDQMAKQSELGVRRFLSIGTCGGLQPDSEPGDILVATSALRDEGSSYHFLPPSDTVEPSPELNVELQNALNDAGLHHRTGSTWTTDVPFRTTGNEIRHYRQQGVSTVEMEAAALFAAAIHYGVQAATALVIDGVADESGEHWNIDLPTASARLRDVLNACTKWLTESR